MRHDGTRLSMLQQRCRSHRHRRRSHRQHRADRAAEKTAAIIELAQGETLDLAQGKPVIVDFNATWCGPCKKFAPTFEEIAGEYAGKALFYSVDVDVHPELAAEYGVQGIPHIQFINPADPAANTSLVGLQTKEDFTAALNAFLK